MNKITELPVSRKSDHTNMMADLPDGEIAIRVLVIEDNADDRELLQHQLRKAGMDSHVRFLSDGREALDFLSAPATRMIAQQLVAILLDLNLPSVNGLELLRHLRGQSEFQAMPVIVMTSSNNPNDLAECRRLGVLHYVSKPITYTSFSQAIANVFHSPGTAAAPDGAG